MAQDINSNAKFELPVLPLRGLVLFPSVVLHFDVGRKKSILAINKAIKEDQLIFLVAQKDIKDEDPNPEQLYSMGVIARVLQIVQQSDNSMRIAVESICRAETKKIISESPFILADVVAFADENLSTKTVKEKALIKKAKSLFEQYVQMTNSMPSEIILSIRSCKNTGELADNIVSGISIDIDKKQEILSEKNVVKRLEKLIYILSDEIEVLFCEGDINARLSDRIDQGQREYYLREQIKIISEELGDEDDPQSESDHLIKEIKKLKLDEKSEKSLIDECIRLSKMPSGSSEANVSRSYIDICLSLPWNNKTKDNINLDKAKKILDRHHYGMEKVKERIIELLAVRKLNNGSKGQIICFVGPPGVGKTSIVSDIAKAMGRKYARVALGGVKDEADIRGHRKTYIGAMPGRIISAIKQAGTSNPIILLDEIDKLGCDYNSDPTSALLEVLDPEQNNTFEDHYIDLPFDLSDVLFITTANDESAIPRPLIDRMEKIEIPSYTSEEKFNIAKLHLIPKQLEKHGLKKSNVHFTDGAIHHMIDEYTSEAGVRSLERCIASVLRKCAKSIVSGETTKVTVDVSNLKEFLGPQKYRREKISKEDEVGIVNGLAWTSVGGEVMPIEVTFMVGTGKIELTGSLGDIMKESAKIAISCIRGHATELDIDPEFYSKFDIHIHVPDGATPKDGPSAGVAIATVLVSALLDIPVKQDVAMTGEITLRGKVLPIGGLREKAMGAYRAGIKKVLIPSDNVPDLEEIDNCIKEKMEFIPITNFRDAIKNALTIDIQNNKRKSHKKEVSTGAPIYIQQ